MCVNISILARGSYCVWISLIGHVTRLSVVRSRCEIASMHADRVEVITDTFSRYPEKLNVR